MSSSPYDHGLDKCAANYVPLSPLSFPERSAQTCPKRLSVIHGTRRSPGAKPAPAAAARACAPALQNAFTVLEPQARSASAIE